ncbi:hypothetical protein SBF1_8840003 [Candidatus Desulfosporosinus infrequens]|uniref:Uncharacterized protein n=1 Tax=Candidatus Desulfosporosinus infrequens TaxID=2043169 RepID=A0A2U3LWG8_9FIRM|nr:hypothetical protein SBF1_8840003 [Candidatus Desulfosporosinus infrequens]
MASLLKIFKVSRAYVLLKNIKLSTIIHHWSCAMDNANFNIFTKIVTKLGKSLMHELLLNYYIGSIYFRQFSENSTTVNADIIVTKKPTKKGHPSINSNTIPYNT